MKNNLFLRTMLFAVIALTLMTNIVNATVWRVNSRAGIDADFSSITDAQNATEVLAGDTLYLEASSGSHGNITLSKSLVIIGPGIFVTENPETQADVNTAVIGSLTFSDGSQGSIVKGCKILNITISASDIILQGNYINNTSSYYTYAVRLEENISNIIIRNNYIRQTYTTYSSEAIRGIETGINNVIIQNNFIEITSTTSSRYALRLLSGFSGIIENNVLYGAVTIYNSEFHNNILRYGNFYSENTSFTHNIGNSTQFGTANNNQQSINMSGVFVGSEGNSTDGQWQLAVGSPAIGAGIDGTDIGMFGGDTPYVLSGMPNIPSIYELNHTIDYDNQLIEVEFSTKSNN